MSTDKDYHEWKSPSLYSTGSQYDDDGFEFISYVSSYNKSQEEYYELQPGIPHRWNLQSFFTDEPSWDPDEKDDGYTYSVFPDQVEFDINWSTDTSGENNNLTWNSYDPAKSDDSNWGFSVSVGPSFGPVSAGISYTADSGPVDVQSDENDYLRWDINLRDFPTSQDDTRGIYVSPEAGSNEREETVRLNTKYGWEYYRRQKRASYGDTIYTESKDLPIYVNPEVTIY